MDDMYYLKYFLIKTLLLQPDNSCATIYLTMHSVTMILKRLFGRQKKKKKSIPAKIVDSLLQYLQHRQRRTECTIHKSRDGELHTLQRPTISELNPAVTQDGQIWGESSINNLWTIFFSNFISGFHHCTEPSIIIYSI